MSDDNDKIVRVTDFVLPAEDFGERVEQVVDSAGSTLGEVERNPRRCDNGDCARPIGHEGKHFNGTEKLDYARGPETQCNRRFNGMRCTLSKGHQSLHLTDDRGSSIPIEWNDGDSDLLAAVQRPPEGQFLTSAQILAYAAKRDRAPIVDYTRQQPLTPKKPWTVNLGMPNGSMILPGLAVTVTEQMQIVFRAKQIICAPSGGKLYITGVFVGQRVQLMQWSGNGMLMDFLKERTDVDFDTAEPGINIAFNVINRGDTPGTFDLTLFGEAVAP